MRLKISSILCTMGVTICNLHQSSSLRMKDFRGLVRYYTGDNTLVDSTWSGNDLVTNGEAAKYETVNATVFSSVSRGVFELNGSQNGGYWLKASTDGLPLGDLDRSMVGWVRIDAQMSNWWAMAFGYGKNGCNNGFDFAVHINSMEIDYHCSVDNDVKFGADYTNFLGQWRHYAFTYDGTNSIVYIDGVKVQQGTLTGPHDILSGDFAIGGNYQGPGLTPFYGAIAEVAVFDRALHKNEVMKIAKMDTAGGGGDPHFFGFGGVFFTWQGVCDAVLFKSPKHHPNESQIEVHIRTRMIRKWSVIDTIAIKVDDFVGEIQSKEGKLVVDGNEVESVQSDSLSVGMKRPRDKMILYTFDIDGDKVLEITVNTRKEMIYNTLSGNFSPDTVGLLGSPNNPGLFTRDGTEMTGKNVNSFAETWQVNDNDSKLFTENREPQFPSKCLYYGSKKKKSRRSRRLKESQMTNMEDAVAACAIHKPGPFRDFCIYDTFHTGDLDIGNNPFYE